MSSILKALRKLEEEKRGGQLEAPDLRVDQGQTASKARPWVYLATGVVCGAALVGLIYVVLGGHKQQTEIAQNELRAPVNAVAEQALPLPQAAAEEPLPSDVSTPPRSIAPGQPVTPAAVAISTSEPGLARGGPPNSPAVERQPKKDQRAAAAVTTRPAGTEAMQAPAPQAAQLPAGTRLLVSEIYYQGDLDSMAVVNDLPVMVGSHIDSALVTEIQVDRVLFDIDGKVFAVSLQKP